MSERAQIFLEGVRRSFTPGSAAVADVTLQVAHGELLALLGPSGCGKTTLLRLIAGLERPDAGAIWLAGRQVAGGGWVPPEQRRVGLVFQEYVLFPHLNVAENIGFGLSAISATAARARVVALLDLVGLADFGARRPHELSGGQQQRVALARALAPTPDVLLLDEPFSNLDAALRDDLRSALRAIVRAAGVTAIVVTHDRDEALALADRVAVMLAGSIVQVAPPRVVYTAPQSAAVAALVGDVTWLFATATGHSAVTPLGNVPLVTPAHGLVQVLLRPEMIHLAHDPQGVGTIRTLRYTGADQHVLVELPETDVVLHVRAPGDLPLAVGERVALWVDTALVAYPSVP